MENLIVAKVPEDYSAQLKKELGDSIRFAIETNRVIVVPESVEIYSIPMNE
jgi:hypothetical protein